jgi:hypothetical protein
MRPAQACQIVEQRLGQEAILGILHHRHRAVALGQALAVGAEDHRHVGESRHVSAHRAVDVDLARRVVHMVVAADAVRDGHVEVVHHHAEIVGRHAVGAQQHEIVQFAVGDLDAALDQVVPGHDAVVRVAKAQDRPDVGRRRPARGILRPPAAVVARLEAGRALRLAHGVQFFLARIAPVGMAALDELIRHFGVALQTLHLVERAGIPAQPEPAHAVEDGVDGSLGRALDVGVLDAQDEAAAMLARIGPGIQRRAGAADMEVAGGAGGEAGADGSVHGLQRAKGAILSDPAPPPRGN